MDSVWDFLRENKTKVVTGVGVIAVSVWAFSKFRRHKRVCGVDYPKDTVMVYGGPSHKYIPNLGHFVMKLETYLRINKIPYKTELVKKSGPKQKVPWIEYNGITMGDSQLIIEFLNREFHIDMNRHLTEEERAHAWAIQKWIEEFTYWLNLYSRWYMLLDDMLDNILELSSIKRFIWKLLSIRTIPSVLYTVGIGRHSSKEVCEMIVKDLKQFSGILGNKKYIMGDTVTEVDCAAFGILSQIRWSTPRACPGYRLLSEVEDFCDLLANSVCPDQTARMRRLIWAHAGRNGMKIPEGGELQNVSDYLDRIKEVYWTNWDEMCEDKTTRF